MPSHLYTGPIDGSVVQLRMVKIELEMFYGKVCASEYPSGSVPTGVMFGINLEIPALHPSTLLFVQTAVSMRLCLRTVMYPRDVLGL